MSDLPPEQPQRRKPVRPRKPNTGATPIGRAAAGGGPPQPGPTRAVSGPGAGASRPVPPPPPTPQVPPAPDDESVAERLIGQTIADCVIERRLGAGSMGAVFLARHPVSKIEVALKLMPTVPPPPETFRERFFREARALSAVSHSAIARVLDVGEDGDWYYIKMRYVDGASLKDHVRNHGAMPVPVLLRVVREIADGMSEAHAAGVIHRDLKPDNLLYNPATGDVTVVDFGVAKVIHGGPALTVRGQVMGTPRFMAPEQGAGQVADERADIYALGAVAYTCLAGQQPYSGIPPMRVVNLKQTEDPRPLQELRPDVPPSVVTLIAQMMARNPDDRPQTMAEIVSDIDNGRYGRLPATAAMPGAASKPAPTKPRGDSGPATQVGGDSTTQPTDVPLPPAPATRPASPGAARHVSGVVRLGDDVPRSEGFRRMKLGEELGRGALGVVINAEDPLLRRDVAIKLLQLSFDPDHVADFIDEAQITGQLEHPNIIPVHEFGFTPDGQPYMAMKRVHGEDLETLIARIDEDVRAARKEGREAEDAERGLSHEERRLIDIFRKVCDAVAYSHSRGVVHRDIKPENVMVGEYGEVLLVDWGIAKPIGGDERRVTTDRRDAGAHQTIQGRISGTPSYMSPEQARGDEIDERSDIYGLGAMLYQIVTGLAPFTGPMDRVLEQVRQGRVRPPSHRARGRFVPRELEAVITKAMAFRPGDRYPSVEELQDDIDAWREGRTLEAAQYSTMQLVAKFAARHKGAVTVAAAALVLVVSIVSFFIISLNQQASEALAARDEAERERRTALAAGEKAEQEAAAAREARDEMVKRQREAGAALDFALAFRARMALNSNDTLASIALLGGNDSAPASAARLLVPVPSAVYRWGLYGHTDVIRCVTFLGDTHRLASSSEDGTVRIWEVDDPDAEPFVHQPHGDSGDRGISCVAIAPDGSRMATVSRDRSVRILDAGTGRELLKFEPGPQEDRGRRSRAGASWVQFTPDSTRLAVACRDGSLRVYDAFDGDELNEFRRPMAVLAAVATHPDNRRVIAGGLDRGIRIYNLDTDEELGELVGHSVFVRALAISPDGRLLASSAYDGTVRLWEIESQIEAARFDLATDEVNCVAFSANGQLLAVGSGDGLVTIFDVVERREVARVTAHAEAVWSVAFTADSRLLATASSDYSIRIWELARYRSEEDAGKQLLAGSRRRVRSVAFSVDGHFLAAGSEDHSVRIWDMTRATEFAVLNGHTNDVRHVAWHPSKTVLASSGNDNRVRVWDAEGRRQLWEGETEADCNAVDYSPDGKWLATGDDANSVRIWNAETGVPDAILDAHDEPVRDVAFSPDGRLLASAGEDDIVCLWSTKDRLDLAHMRGPNSDAECLAFSPDGRLLVCGADNGTVCVWDLATQELRHTLQGHEDSVYGVAFSPDGAFLVSGSADQTVVLWNPDTGDELMRVRDSQPVRALAVSPDGQLLISGRNDGRVRIWGGVVPGSPEAGERLSGLTRTQFQIRPYGRDREKELRQLWPMPPAVWQGFDPAVAEYWQSFWAVVRNLKAEQPTNQAAKPLREWLRARTGHRLTRAAERAIAAVEAGRDPVASMWDRN